jgi:hypothetical protein
VAHGRTGGLAGDGARFDQTYAQACLGKFSRARATDDAGAEDEDVEARH